MATVASKTPFFVLAGLLEKLSTIKGTDNKKKLLHEFIKEWHNHFIDLHGRDTTSGTIKNEDSFYPVMRLLLPQLERDREAYGIKEVMLAKLYIEILGLGQGSPAADKLKNFRGPKNNKNDMGDFANTAFWILKPRCPEKGTLTIEQVNHHLDEIAKNNAQKNKEGVKKHLLVMLRDLSAKEQKWLIRMILKDMKLGISQQSVFSVFHEDAEDLFNVKMSLKDVCNMLKDPNTRLHEIEISLFSPYRPMLGDRGAPSKIEKSLQGKEYFIETKFDGERMQLHKDGNKYAYFSRSGNPYTNAFGADPYSGTFSPAVHNCFKPHIKNCILDGEMVGYNPETKTRGSKGMNFDVKSAHSDEFQPMLCVFDVLMINGEVLSNKPLRVRKERLKEIFNPSEGRLQLSEYTTGRTNQDCVDALNEAIDLREEGIMVKDPDSPYKPNARKGGWYKVKPEYVDGLMDELDLLVVGGFFGKGHRSQLLSHFLCAVAVPNPNGGKPRLFHSFCKVGSGYTRKELHDFNERLKPYFKTFNPSKPPSWLELNAGRQRPEIYIEPDKSYILQVKAAEITSSDQYKTGCTLRFPRVEKIRTDKNWYDCMTTEDVKQYREKAEGKLTGGYVAINDADEPVKKKRKIIRNVKPTLMARFRGVDATTVTQISEIFRGKEMCVTSGSGSYSKLDLEKKIIEFGGSIAQNPGKETYCVIADKTTIKVKNIISKGIYNVVKVQWLLQCVEDKRFIPWVPSDMLFSNPESEKLFLQEYDKFGDSYYDDTDVEKLKTIFSKIEDEHRVADICSEDIAHMEMKYFAQDSVGGLFRLCRVYLDRFSIINDKDSSLEDSALESVKLDLQLHGATIQEKITSHTSHVIVWQKDTCRIDDIKSINRSRVKKFHLVTEDWVEDSINSEKLLQERHYSA